MNFAVYSKDNCPYCFKVKQVLELTGSNYVVYNLGEDFTKEEFYSEFGKGSTFPQVICDEKKIGGSVINHKPTETVALSFYLMEVRKSKHNHFTLFSKSWFAF
jgi:glutaredoxin